MINPNNNQFLRIDCRDGKSYALLCDHCDDGVSVTFWEVATGTKLAKMTGCMVIDKPFHVVCDMVYDHAHTLSTNLQALAA